jgi:hypothetical protein
VRDRTASPFGSCGAAVGDAARAITEGDAHGRSEREERASTLLRLALAAGAGTNGYRETWVALPRLPEVQESEMGQGETVRAVGEA